MTYSAEALATGSVKAYFRTRRSITVTSSASATATSNISYEDAYKIALGIAQDVANSAAQNDANVMQVSVDTSTIGETEIYLDSSLLRDYVTAQGNTYTLNRDFTLGNGLTLLVDANDKFVVIRGVTLTIENNSEIRILGTLYNDGTLNCLGTFNNFSNKTIYNTLSISLSNGTNSGTIFNGYNPNTTPVYNNIASCTITSGTYTNNGTFYNLAIFYIAPGSTFTSTNSSTSKTPSYFYCAYNPPSTTTYYFNNYIQNLGTCTFSGNIYLANYIFNCATNIQNQDGGYSYSIYKGGTCLLTFSSAVVVYEETNIIINYPINNSYLLIEKNNESSSSSIADFTLYQYESNNNYNTYSTIGFSATVINTST